MSVSDTIRRKLSERFAPTRLEIVDESHRHAGHEGARPEGETHFAVTIVSTAFIGRGRLARQRLVYQTLTEELATRVHALSLTTLAPDEVPAKAPHPNPLPASGEREGPASREGEGRQATDLFCHTGRATQPPR